MSKRGKKAQKRILRYEFLETRALMAGDLCFQNIEMPEDVDGSGFVSPLDALIGINQLNLESLGGSLSTSDGSSMTDVNGDTVITPLDVLMVINHLNKNAAVPSDNPVSDVSVETRIARIEQAIATDRISKKFSVDDAVDILATLRLGGRPESGDFTLEGKLHRVNGEGPQERPIRLLEDLTRRLDAANVSTEIVTTITKEIVDAKVAGTPLTHDQIKLRLTELGVDVTKVFVDGPVKDGPTETRDRLADFLGRKLAAEGVKEEIITTITKEIVDAKVAGKPLTIEQVRTRLTELGVDISKIFPGPPKDEDGGPRRDPLLEGITRRLETAGVTTEVITTITKEIVDAKVAGAPLTIEQIRTRLTELGVDVTKIFPGPPKDENGGPQRDPLLEGITRRLEAAGVTAEVITTITKEIVDAKVAGTPLTIERIRTRLTELGVDVTKIFPGPPKDENGGPRRDSLVKGIIR